MSMFTGTIIADPHELAAYKTALESMGCKIISEKGMSCIDGEKDFRFALTFSYSDVSMVFHAGILMRDIQDIRFQLN